jgi:isoleucyl-tRNA synthetase
MLAEGGVCAKCSTRQSSDAKKCSECGGKVLRKTEKMSKRLRNYRPPNEIFDLYGADALRWYFFANQPPWTSIIYSERAIKESIPEFLLRTWNVYSFFKLYADIDGFEPSSVNEPGQLTHDDLSSGNGFRPINERSELDRWIISELNRTIKEVTEAMDDYDNYGAAKTLNHFVDVLSNWYVRRSRDRFWAKDKQDPNKLDAYWTLFECLATLSKLNAPFVPFITENIWQNLTQTFREKGASVPESVHLCDYPVSNPDLYDEDLSRRMELLRQIASQGLSARMNAKLKVRQPLSGVTVVLSSDQDQAWLETHCDLLMTELNVRDVTFTLDAQQYVNYQVVPNFKLLGPRVGKLMPKVKQAFAAADGGEMLESLTKDGKASIEVEGQSIELTDEDVEVRLQAKEGWAAAQGAGVVVVLATELTPELIRAGLSRDLVRLVQDHRKEKDLERTDRIELVVCTDADDVRLALDENNDYFCGETLTISLTPKPLAEAEDDFIEKTVGDHVVKIGLAVAKA